jgi:predicted enzyme related to lactoylglutathione lyase
MKRLHMHVSVTDLEASIRFYRSLFGTEPAVTQSDYAKWMLEEPRIHFAISTNRQPVGIIAWETFHTLGNIPIYGEDTAVFNHGASVVPVSAAMQCCVPAQNSQPATTCCAK